jgi:hypothetical protein
MHESRKWAVQRQTKYSTRARNKISRWQSQLPMHGSRLSPVATVSHVTYTDGTPPPPGINVYKAHTVVLLVRMHSHSPTQLHARILTIEFKAHSSNPVTSYYTSVNTRQTQHYCCYFCEITARSLADSNRPFGGIQLEVFALRGVYALKVGSW